MRDYLELVKYGKVLGFKKEPHKFLSNMALLPEGFKMKGFTCTSTESFYQAMKSLDVDERSYICSLPPYESKHYSKGISVREDWHEVRGRVMFYALTNKFNRVPLYKRLLLETGKVYLEETNWWHDYYWGVCNGQGENMLGRMLMNVREELQNAQVP